MTAKQRELLRFLEQFLSQYDGVAPSFVEMADAMGLASKSGVHRLLAALEEQGRIRRRTNRSRAIEIVARDVDLSRASDQAIAAEYHRRFPGRLPLPRPSAVTSESVHA